MGTAVRTAHDVSSLSTASLSDQLLSPLIEFEKYTGHKFEMFLFLMGKEESKFLLDDGGSRYVFLLRKTARK